MKCIYLISAILFISGTCKSMERCPAAPKKAKTIAKTDFLNQAQKTGKFPTLVQLAGKAVEKNVDNLSEIDRSIARNDLAKVLPSEIFCPIFRIHASIEAPETATSEEINKAGLEKSRKRRLKFDDVENKKN